MKATRSNTFGIFHATLHVGIGLFTAILLQLNATAAPIAVNLGTASNFGILAGSQITDAGGSSVVVQGDVGLSPATGAGIGLTSGQVLGGTIYSVDAFGPLGSVQNAGLLTTAQNDLTAAYNDAAARPVDIAFGVVDNQLGGQVLFPGVYSFGHAATANLIGNLTLNGNGEANPIWIFQATSDLIVASGSSITMIGGTSCDVFWQVGSSATIGTATAFVGNILADQSIALQTGATLDGSAQARIGAVTLDHNVIERSPCFDDNGSTSVPDGGDTAMLLSSGLLLLMGLARISQPPVKRI